MLMTPELQKTLEKLSLTRRRLNMVNWFPAYENPYKLTSKQFMHILEVHNEALVLDMCETGNMYRFSLDAGVLAIVKTNKRVKNSGKDWKTFYETKGEVCKPLRNNHTHGYSTRIILDNTSSVPKAPAHVKNCISFTATRTFKRYLGKCIFEKNTMNLYTNEN